MSVVRIRSTPVLGVINLDFIVTPAADRPEPSRAGARIP
jgi:hypothetical protein